MGTAQTCVVSSSAGRSLSASRTQAVRGECVHVRSKSRGASIARLPVGGRKVIEATCGLVFLRASAARRAGSPGWSSRSTRNGRGGLNPAQASSGYGENDSSSNSRESSPASTTNGEDVAEEAEKKEPVQIEVAPAVLRMLEKAEKRSPTDQNGGLSLIERNLKKRQGTLGKGKDDEKPPAIIPLSFDADARMDEGRYDGAFYARLDENEEETLEINTLDDFYPAFVILLTDALLELGDLMKMFGDGAFFSIQALSRASRMPGQKTSTLKGFPEDTQLRKSLENILVYVQALSFYISTLFAGPDGRTLNTDESLDTEADLLYNMYYKYKHRETLTAPLDEKELLEQVLSKSSFVAARKAVRCRQGLIFSGEYTNSPTLARLEMQKVLDEKYGGLVAILLDRDRIGGERGCLIAHRNELLSFSLPKKGDVILSSSLLAGALIGCLQYVDADVGLDEVYFWQKTVVALGLLGVGASGWLARKAAATLYNVSHMVRLPFSLPVPHQGAFGTVVFYKGCLPNRTCLLDLSLSNAFASLAVSSALIWASFSPWGSVSATVADFRGLLLVPDQMFAYSNALTWVLHKLSIATLSGELGDLNLVVSPLALAGILGLHLTAMGLLPLGILDGGRIVTGIFGRGVQHVVTATTFVGVGVVLLATSPWLGVAWLIGSTPAVLDDWFQIDEVTQPDFIRKAVGLAMVVASVGTFLPALP